MKYYLGCVNYINSLPYSIPLSKNKQISIIYDSPTKLFSLFSQKKLDIVITSSSHSFLSNQDNFISSLGIAANNSILSVNFYVSNNLFQKRNPIIKVTNESSTSVLLLKILCKFYWHLTPIFIGSTPDIKTITKNCDGFLLIGNQALFYPKVSNFSTLDLAKEWFNFSQLPFIFALCYMHKDQNYDDNIEKLLQESLNWSSNHLDFIINTAFKLYGLKKDILKQYFQLCIYHLSKKHLEGLNKFQYLYEKL